MTETTLWTNSDSTVSFAAQSVTLSDNISNYSYVKIKWKISRTASDEASIIIPTEDFVLMTGEASTHMPAIGNMGSSLTYYTRAFYYASDTSVYFYYAYAYNSATANANVDIPTEIIGLK